MPSINTWNRLLSIVLALILLPLLTMTPAMASPLPDCSHCAAGRVYGATGWSGSYRVAMPGLGERHVFCIEPGKWYAQGNYSRAAVRTDEAGQRLGYLIWRWAGQQDPDRSAAISMLAARHAAGDLSQWNSLPQLHSLADALWAESGANAGPYSVADGQVVQAPSIDNGLSVTVDFQVLGGPGAPPAFEFPADLAESFEMGNVQGVSIVRKGPASFRVEGSIADPAQPWSVGLRLVNLPAGVDVWRSSVTQAQDVIGYATQPVGPSRVVRGDAPQVPRYQPTVVTKTSAQLVSPGASLADQLELSGGVQGEAFDGVTRLFGPFATDAEAQSADLSTSAPVGEVRFSGDYGVDGRASLVSDSLTVPEAGFYVWVEELSATATALAFAQPVEQRPAETTVALKPTMESQVSSTRVTSGGTITDDLRLTGLARQVGGTSIKWSIEGGLYGPVDPGSDGTCATSEWSRATLSSSLDRPIASNEIDADGNAELPRLASAEVPAGSAGKCLSWGWTLRGEAADASTLQVVHAPGHPTQTAAITFSPGLRTQTSAQLVAAGARVHDTVQVFGGIPGRSFAGVTALHGPFDSNDAALKSDVTDRRPIAERQFDGRFGADGTAMVVTEPVQVPEKGFYVWVEELRATPFSEAVLPDVARRAPETTVALQPVITSAVSTQRVADGGTLSDTVQVTGLTPRVGDSSIVWKLTGLLHGPIPVGADGTCVSSDWAKAPVAAEHRHQIAPEAISADGSVTLADVASSVVHADGAARCFSWAWELDGHSSDGSTISASHGAGDPSQTAVITYEPTVTTAVQTQLLAELPASLVDEVIVSGGIVGHRFAGSTVLYGPFASDDEAQLVDVTSMTPLAVRTFEGVYDETGAAAFATEPATVTEFGYYVWVETLDETTQGGVADEPEPADRATETVLVAEPAIATQVSAQQADRGSTITDTVRITGLHAAVGRRGLQWSLDVVLHGPIAPNSAGTCLDLDWSGAPVALTQTRELDAQTAIADELTLTDLGAHRIDTHGAASCYTYSERLTARAADGSVITVLHEPGEVSQTAFVPFAGQIISGETPKLPALSGGAWSAAAAGMLFAGFAGLFVRRRS